MWLFVGLCLCWCYLMFPFLFSFKQLILFDSNVSHLCFHICVHGGLKLRLMLGLWLWLWQNQKIEIHSSCVPFHFHFRMRSYINHSNETIYIYSFNYVIPFHFICYSFLISSQLNLLSSSYSLYSLHSQLVKLLKSIKYNHFAIQWNQLAECKVNAEVPMRSMK